MGTTISELRRKTETDRAAAMTRYIAIVSDALNEHMTADDAAAVAREVSELSLTPEDVLADKAAVMQARHILRQRVSDDDVQRQQAENAKTIAAADAEFRDLLCGLIRRIPAQALSAVWRQLEVMTITVPATKSPEQLQFEDISRRVALASNDDAASAQRTADAQLADIRLKRPLVRSLMK